MCLDLRNGNFSNIGEVEFILRFVPKTTDDELIKANKDKKAYKKLMDEAELNQEFELIYG